MSAAGAPPCDHGRASALRRELRRDLARYPRARRRGWLGRLALLASPQLAATVLYRGAHLLHVRGWRRAAFWLALVNFYIIKVSLASASCIAGGLFLPSPVGVVFQGRAGRRLTLYTQSVCFAGGAALAPSLDGAPRLGDGVSIGVHASVCGAVRVGSRVRLAFNVALGRDAPDGARVVSRAMRSAVRNGSVTAP